MVLLTCVSQPLSAQFPSWDDFVEQLLTEVSDEGDESATIAENLYDDYAYLHAHPLNINSADSLELKRLGFLTDRQIENIHYYIYRYGAIRSVGELMLIPQLDYRTRQLLSYFVTFGEPRKEEQSPREKWYRILTKGRSELSTRLDVPLYQRAGYAQRSQSQLDASPSSYYMGNALYHSLRYTYRYGSRFSWGFSTEKDAGEPLFGTLQPLPDYLSGYVQLGDMGVVQNLVVGNYRLRFGQGLVMNSDFSLGKTMMLDGVERLPVALKPHRGTGEGDYCTGVAATLAWHSWQLTAFASYRKLDATLDGMAVRTLKEDGYHRTLTELERKGNTLGNIFGAHLGYSAHGFHLGATTLYQSFNRMLAPSSSSYKRFSPQGHMFFNASVDYAWHHHRVSILGETAVDAKGSVATLNMIRLKIIDELHLTLLHRHYARDYWGLEAKSFSSSSDIRNERGLYLGAEWQPHRKLQITAYADAYRFPYLRYRVSAPSCGGDARVVAHYSINTNHALNLRYRYRLKQRDVAQGYCLPDGGLLNEHTHRLHASWEGALSPNFTLRTLFEGCMVVAEKYAVGSMGSLQAAYNPTVGLHALRFGAGVTAFSAAYAARLYGYERGLLYAYNYQMYYGTGLRSYFLVQYAHREVPRLTATAKLGCTYYFDRSAISSGPAMINDNHREDIQLQVRYTF